MKLEKGKLYSKPTSGLLMEVIKIHHQGEDKVCFKGRLWSKTRSILYETKNYKLPIKRISDWEEIHI